MLVDIADHKLFFLGTGKSLEDMSEVFGDIKRRTEPELGNARTNLSDKKDGGISEYAIEKTESK